MKALGQSFAAPAMTWLRAVLVLGSLMGGFGCKPKIGEDCATSVDCSLSGDRLCDVTLPGGYCTVFNCEPNGCPEEAACVAFSEGTCSTAAVSVRFRRTFCMRTCEDDSDCRGGSYHCIDISRDESRQVVDRAPANRRVCAVAASTRPPSMPEPAVCFPSDASFDVSRPEAGPRRDAVSDTGDADSSTMDGTIDASDANAESGSEAATDAVDSGNAEASADASNDELDSSSSETSTDAAVDSTDGPDATSEDATVE
jgi:hypothetical protein